jgi:hypothetical protein
VKIVFSTIHFMLYSLMLELEPKWLVWETIIGMRKIKQLVCGIANVPPHKLWRKENMNKDGVA